MEQYFSIEQYLPHNWKGLKALKKTNSKNWLNFQELILNSQNLLSFVKLKTDF